jgi:hypothetical protein
MKYNLSKQILYLLLSCLTIAYNKLEPKVSPQAEKRSKSYYKTEEFNNKIHSNYKTKTK